MERRYGCIVAILRVIREIMETIVDEGASILQRLNLWRSICTFQVDITMT